MNVTQFDPNDISVTEPARRHIAAQIAKSGRRHLRLGVKESGCNGFMYTLDYVDRPDATDRRFEIGDIELYVREEELPLVQGTEVDFVVEGLNASLKFKNPHARSYCGCGESFSMGEAD